MVPAQRQIDILDISGRLTIQNSADEEPDSFLKVVLCVDRDVAALVVAGGREVAFNHLAPGSLNILKFGESLGPSPV